MNEILRKSQRVSVSTLLRPAALLLGPLLLASPAAARDAGEGSVPDPGAPVASVAQAAPPAPAPSVPASAPPTKKRALVPFGTWRLRQEVWDWFGDGLGGADRYTFTGSLLRFGAAYTSPRHDLTIELAQPTLLNLPTDASLAPPLGQLGLGAAYRDANAPTEASIFIKQGFWRVKGVGSQPNSLRLGRFEFIDGTETVPKDASLAWMKRERIAHRLLGNFGFSHVQRSFDGAQFVRNTPGLNLTFMGGLPTQGVFDLDGNDTLSDVQVGYGAATVPLKARRFAGEARLFGLYYSDGREAAVKTDNRPLPVRTADTSAIHVATIGGHWLGVRDLGSGTLDGLVWGAGQFGDWGRLTHGALAYAAEVGYQPRDLPGKPWFRAGFSHFSGDGNPNNDQHGTFFPVLPTPRIYARFPFYTEMNLNDAFLQVLLRPHRKVNVRGDVHFLTLADRDDLWYVGGGAFQREPLFGYAGRPSNGNRDLGTLYDVSVDYQALKNTTLTAYLGYATGGDVIGSIYTRSNHGLFAYLELTQRW